ncbi:hypothetical protein ACFYNF_34455 [Streptomyces sp. NPDC006641]|uniref:hypothetical protein n=1 Tax=unclassified Streptomyces TaxID=2593676 RepID=UPI00368562E9
MSDRRVLNDCGFSIDTIAAEYETDQALRDTGNDMEDPYFTAAWTAEQEQRQLDLEATR